VRLGRETSLDYFSCSAGHDALFTKKHVGTRYIELVFLHPVGSAAYIMYFGASGT
jgi:hypothetical protein